MKNIVYYVLILEIIAICVLHLLKSLHPVEDITPSAIDRMMQEQPASVTGTEFIASSR